MCNGLYKIGISYTKMIYNAASARKLHENFKLRKVLRKKNLKSKIELFIFTYISTSQNFKLEKH